MNPTILHEIQTDVQALLSRSFDQRTLKVLLVNIRDLISNKNSPCRELGDFLAHPHERNKGLVFANIQGVHRQLSDALGAFLKSPTQMSTSFKLPIKSAFDQQELIDDLLHSLASIQELAIDLAPLKSTTETHPEILACVICLIQGSRFKMKDTYAEARIGVNPASKSLGLFASLDVPEARARGITWEVVKSEFQCEPDLWPANMPGAFDRPMKTIRVNGHLKLVPIYSRGNCH